MDKSTYQHYADLEAQKDAIQEQQNELKVIILSDLRQLPEGKNGVDTDFGTFTLQSKKTYKFLPTTEALAKQVEQLKADEIARGDAKIKTFTEFPVFRPVKVASDASVV